MQTVTLSQIKPFLTFSQQADLLLRRGLLANKDKLLSLLHSVNYYRFKGYLQPFRETIIDANGKKVKGVNYVTGTTLEKVWSYYLFDRRLRFLVMDAIERIEIALRTQIAYQWAQFTGCSNPQGDVAHYSQPRESSDIEILLQAVQRAFDRRHAHITRQQPPSGSSVKSLPVWVFVELTTLGELTRIYRWLHPSLRENIAYEFGFSNERESSAVAFFTSLMNLFQHARNACAHHARIWNVEWNQRTKQGTKIHPVVGNSTLPDWNLRWVESSGAWLVKPGKHSFPRQSTAFLLTACSYFINKVAPHSSWKHRFKELVERPDTPRDVVKAIKFTEHWRTHPFWDLGDDSPQENTN